MTAMRAAGVLARLAAEGRAVDRAGGGVVFEVYPAASLQVWGLPHRGYKGAANTEQRAALVSGIQSTAPWLDLGPHVDLCLRSDDALDAVVAALTSRAAACSLATIPTLGAEREQAQREGWIALPTAPLSALVDR